jgi:nucleoside phosphorylase
MTRFRPERTVGIITALPIECFAVQLMLDDVQEAEAPMRGDPATYYLGTAPSRRPGAPHRVALCLLPEDGGVAAAHACTNLQRSWGVRQIIMCGIACGVPMPDDPARHVRLGDVLVADDGVVAYGHVREMPTGEEIRRHTSKPSLILKHAARRLQLEEEAGRRPWDRLLDVRGRPGLQAYRRPVEPPNVFLDDDSDIPVPHPPSAQSGHLRGRPKVHYGRLGSGGKLIRSSTERNRLAQRYRLLGFDMEGDGVSEGAYLQGAEWFMVRGVSDYGVRKNDQWHRYASLAAAAYVHALLGQTAPLDEPPSRPAVGGTSILDDDTSAEIVAALLEVRTMADRAAREGVIDALPASYRTRQARSLSAYHDVQKLVENLRRTPDGLRILYRILADIEQDSAALRRLGQLIGE